MKRIINHLSDNDLYTFSVMYYILQKYPRAEVGYTFFDRNNTRYPKGFDKMLQEQVNMAADLVFSDEELKYMQDKIYFLPTWYFIFLKGYRFNPKEVQIFQDASGYLSISIQGKWFSTIMWEMYLLPTISEMMNIINGRMDEYDAEYEWKKAYEKGVKAFRNGLFLADMGTRRRFSFEHQKLVLDALVKAYEDCKKDGTATGKLTGTSNVFFAKEFNLTPIGTMSHQVISFEECVSGVFECNYNMMQKWADVYKGDLGIYLCDCFGNKAFFNNFSKDVAKLFDGLRIDSGDEREETEMVMERYKELGIDPSTKSIVYSNALTIDKAIDLHNWVGKRMKDSYGIGTYLMADVTSSKTKEKFPYSNIVIKLTRMPLTESREWHDCVKLSCDKGKTLGDREKCEFLVKELSH